MEFAYYKKNMLGPKSLSLNGGFMHKKGWSGATVPVEAFH